MMQRLWNILSSKVFIVTAALAVLAALLFLMTIAFDLPLSWLAITLGILLAVLILKWGWRYWKKRRAARQLGSALEKDAGLLPAINSEVRSGDVAVLRERMLDAIKTIKQSRLGDKSGTAALYELPWYMMIGNPAAGKSSAIINSGLQFPYADKGGKIIHGAGGTRNCDWFFTSDGILLDTAGRYSVYAENRSEWFSFLGLLKRYRRQAPINGIIIAVSIAELSSNRPEFGIDLAKDLRQRVQELTERLEVFAPVYVIFTKADLITGFDVFFGDSEPTERNRVWGATIAYDRQRNGQQVVDFFDQRFDELYEGLKEMSLATMALRGNKLVDPGVLAFPLEFAALKETLRSFLATLFEENPFQFKPVFRGFYFTSALQEGATMASSSERIADRFGLQNQDGAQPGSRELLSQHGFFLHNLFRQVIFADRQLVAQYVSKTKIQLRYITFFCAVAILGLALGGWCWSYMGNRQLIDNVRADFQKVIRLQSQKVDLQSRLQALEILQDRIEQLDQYRKSRPLSLSLGLYQGDLLERKLREEYFAGIKEIMLKPVAAAIESYLIEVNANAGALQPMQHVQPLLQTSATSAERNASTDTGLRTYKDVSVTSVEDAYNALKTYLMLNDKSRAEAGHLNDQITRFWRGWLESNRGTMPREQMIRSAERLISFSLTEINDPFWPTVDNKLTLVDQTRDNLRRVVRGMQARERVYTDVKARAATRFAPVTVARIVGGKDSAIVAGSYAIPGTFTREAWEKFVKDAFHEAATKELQSSDWVLKTSSHDDLTLEGSPEQIQKALVTQYKAEYAQEWQKFLQGVSVAELRNLDDAAAAMNRIGDPLNSPVGKIINEVYDQTSWDNPSVAQARVVNASQGVAGWVKEHILRRSPVPIPLPTLNPDGTSSMPMGAVGREFAGVTRLVVRTSKDTSYLGNYLDILSRLRTRLNQIKTQGDTGPGAKQLMQQTLEGNGSELSDALKYVDEEMLPGMNDAQRAALRPILVRPLIQGFNALIQPTEGEVNKLWQDQVYGPFQTTLSGKYPFSPNSRIEANSTEITSVFGENGAIAKFVNGSLGPLVVRRGDVISMRTWADMGIHLAPEMSGSFADWVGASPAADGGQSAQTQFQIKPEPAQNATEYAIEIDGQQLRYRNTQADWSSFMWPNPQGTPGAKITALTTDGRSVEIANQPGRFGLERLINTAERNKRDDGAFELHWTGSGITVSVLLKVISSPQVNSTAGSGRGTRSLQGLQLPQKIVGGANPGSKASAAAPDASAVVGDTPPQDSSGGQL